MSVELTEDRLTVAMITRNEEKAIAARPTQVPEAYDEYLRGIAIWTQFSQGTIVATNAARHFSRAVELLEGIGYGVLLLSKQGKIAFSNVKASVLLARDQAVAAGVDEELGPEIPVSRVDRIRVVRIELDERVVLREREGDHASITSRQYL